MLQILDSQLGTLQADIANWDKFVPGLEFENTWQGNERYQPGDFVTYGGNQYVANDNVYGEVPPSSAKWDLVTSGFNLRGDWGADSQTQEYRIGDVVRLGGYTYVAVANSTGQRPKRYLLGKIKPKVLNGKILGQQLHFMI